MDGILPLKANYYPVLGQLMNEIDLANVINRAINIPDSQANIDVGTVVCLILHNMLADVNVKMYKMDDFFTDKAMPLLRVSPVFLRIHTLRVYASSFSPSFLSSIFFLYR